MSRMINFSARATAVCQSQRGLGTAPHRKRLERCDRGLAADGRLREPVSNGRGRPRPHRSKPRPGDPRENCRGFVIFAHGMCASDSRTLLSSLAYFVSHTYKISLVLQTEPFPPRTVRRSSMSKRGLSRCGQAVPSAPDGPVGLSRPILRCDTEQTASCRQLCRPSRTR